MRQPIRTAPAVLAALLVSTLVSPLAAETAGSWKDVGPAGACDQHPKDSMSWTVCVGAANGRMPEAELFYAGYWLARTGRYREALGYLSLANQKDERVLTYIGFATRKLGDVDGAFPLYARALAINPGYNVARAYLGEAYLSKGEAAKARAELAEIEWRCGKTCAEYADLARHISEYETSPQGKNG